MKTLRLTRSFLRLALFLCASLAVLNPFARAANHSSAPPPPTIYAFEVFGDPTINLGTTSTLNWSVGGATTLSISPDVGPVTGTSIAVTPTATTTYTLTASNAGGTVTKTKRITVVAPPVIDSFTASAASINAGASATLSWSAPRATSFTITTDVGGDLGTVSGPNVTVRPAATTTYTLIARNAAGTATQTVTIAVTAPLPKPAIAAFAAAPASITAGSPTTLSWSVTGATSLSISPDVGPITGSAVTVRPAANTTYTLTATNASGSVTKKVAVIVTTAPVPPPAILSFTASPTNVLTGSPITLAWSVSGATSLSISPNLGVVTGTSVSVTPTVNTTYVLTATNASGSVTKSVDVTVTTPVPGPVIGSFTASPTSVALGASSTLSWSVSGATSLSISAGIGAVTGTSVTVTPTATTTYVLTATNAGASVTRSIDVAVTTPVAPPSISSFTASPASITAGTSSTLTWVASGATSFSISSDVGASPGNVTGTSVSVTPTATTVYTLTAGNVGGSVTKTVSITVTAAPPSNTPVIASFTATPAQSNSGDPVVLTWSVSGAESLYMSADAGGDIGTVNGLTSITVNPKVTTRYALSAYSTIGGIVFKSVTVSIGAPPPPPPPPTPVIGSFVASPDTISIGASTILTWSVANAVTIAIRADPGTSPGLVTGSSLSVTPAVNTTYTLTATNEFGSVTQATTVTVTGPMPPAIGSFTASPAFIAAGSGGSSTLNWSVSGADKISLSADAGASPGVVTGTSLTVSPTVSTLYTLSATNAIGTSTASVPVTIFAPSNGSVTHPRIWVTPASAAALNQRAAANDPAWIKLRNDCDAYLTKPILFPDQPTAGDTIAGEYQFQGYLLPSEELALGYVAAKTADPVRAAKYAAKERELLLALSDPVRHGRPTTDSGWAIRMYVPTLALGYDWIYETLSDADRAQIYTEINRWVKSFDESGFNREFPNGNYFAGYYCAKALGALATEGDNPNATSMWNDWLNRIHFGMVQPYYAQWLSGGGSPDGWNYGPFETVNMLRPIAAAFTAKGIDLIHGPKPFAYPDGNATWIANFTWPDLKTVNDRGIANEHDNPTAASADWATEYNGLLRLANGTNAALMQQFTQDVRAFPGAEHAETWAEFLFQDDSAPRQDFRTALSARTLGDGQVAMRSSWATDAVWGAFQAGPFTGYQQSGEQYFDEGSLAIQRGHVQFLVNATGALMRNTPGTSDASLNKLGNVIYAELFDTQSDGVYHGRRIFNTYYAVRDTGYWGESNNGPGETTATLSRFEEGGSYVLMRGANLETMYLTGHPISGWNRTILYVRPKLFIAYDRTSVKNANVDHWMAWHVGPTPVEQAGAVAGTHRFDVTDNREAFGGNLYRGRVTTLLPAGHVVNTVDVFNRGKVYRLEIRPGTPAPAATWLSVFDASASAAEATSAAPLTAAAGNVLSGAVEGTVISAAGGHNVVALFSRSGATIASAVQVLVPAADMQCLVTDLSPNTGYAVTATLVNGNFSLQITPGGGFVTSAQGTLSVNVSATGTVTP